MRTDNPALAGLLMGLGAFFENFAQARVERRNYELAKRKLDDAEKQQAGADELARRRIAVDEQANVLRAESNNNQRLAPFLKHAADAAYFDEDLAHKVSAEQQLGFVRDQYDRDHQARAHQNAIGEIAFRGLTLPKMQLSEGVPVTGAARANTLDPTTGLPFKAKDKAIADANALVRAEAAKRPASTWGASLFETPEGNLDLSRLPPAARDLWARSFLMSVGTYEYDRPKITGFLQNMAIPDSTLREFGLEPKQTPQEPGQGDHWALHGAPKKLGLGSDYVPQAKPVKNPLDELLRPNQ